MFAGQKVRLAAAARSFPGLSKALYEAFFARSALRLLQPGANGVFMIELPGNQVTEVDGSLLEPHTDEALFSKIRAVPVSMVTKTMVTTRQMFMQDGMNLRNVEALEAVPEKGNAHFKVNGLLRVEPDGWLYEIKPD